jgi:Holliday junction DNA helicase RuvA
MIGKLTGIISGTQGGGSVVVEVGGVGYCVRMPLSMSFSEGERVSLYIHTAVRDDAIDLYGFTTEEDLSLFRLLMSVSGVGPKTALSIMGVSDSGALKRAIAGGDASVLHKVFGIGRKSAERIVVELKDKLQLETGAKDSFGESGGDAEIVEALLALGYSMSECRKALRALGPSEGEQVKERLGAALRQLGSRTAV